MIGDWPEHKFIFAKPMKTKADGITLTSAGAIAHQGFGNNEYCFKRPAGTVYYATGVVTPGSTGATEVAFPGDIPISYINSTKTENREPSPGPQRTSDTGRFRNPIARIGRSRPTRLNASLTMPSPALVRDDG